MGHVGLEAPEDADEAVGELGHGQAATRCPAPHLVELVSGIGLGSSTLSNYWPDPSCRSERLPCAASEAFDVALMSPLCEAEEVLA